MDDLTPVAGPLERIIVEFPAIRSLDADAMSAAAARQGQLTKPSGALGRLEPLSVWLCGAQGACPPALLEQVRVVVVAGDHGVARAAATSAYPTEVTAQMVGGFLAGAAAVNVLADLVGAQVRVVDASVDGETPSAVTAWKVMRGSGSIDREDAMTVEQCLAAIAAGRAIVDAEVDAGCDLLVPGDMGIGNTTPAAALASVLTGLEPAVVVGRGTGVDDATWMRKTEAVRDATRRGRPFAADPVRLLAAIGGADLAMTVGMLAQAAVRQTPVVLDGVISCVCALIADRLAPGARQWWVAGHRSTEPAQGVALEHLGLEPLLDVGMRLGEGTGGLLAVPLMQAAAATLARMATFSEAGVSERPDLASGARE